MKCLKRTSGLCITILPIPRVPQVFMTQGLQDLRESLLLLQEPTVVQVAQVQLLVHLNARQVDVLQVYSVF